MNIWTRIKNLWALSVLEPMQIGERLEIGDKHIALKEPRKMAQIIKMRDPIKEALKQE